MKDRLLIQHLAIPCRHIGEGVLFYKTLGCDVGREYDESAIINFFGSQLVLHKSDKWEKEVEMYPRHLGLIIDTDDAYTVLETIWARYVGSPTVWSQLFTRNEGLFEEHKTFFLVDPSNNLIEFKAYRNSESIFGSIHG